MNRWPLERHKHPFLLCTNFVFLYKLRGRRRKSKSTTTLTDPSSRAIINKQVTPADVMGCIAAYSVKNKYIQLSNDARGTVTQHASNPPSRMKHLVQLTHGRELPVVGIDPSYGLPGCDRLSKHQTAVPLLAT